MAAPIGEGAEFHLRWSTHRVELAGSANRRGDCALGRLWRRSILCRRRFFGLIPHEFGRSVSLWRKGNFLAYSSANHSIESPCALVRAELKYDLDEELTSSSCFERVSFQGFDLVCVSLGSC